jgi:hypothetical protein
MSTTTEPANHYEASHPLFWQAHYRDEVRAVERLLAHAFRLKDGPLRSAMLRGAYALRIEALNSADCAAARGLLLTAFVPDPLPEVIGVWWAGGRRQK